MSISDNTRKSLEKIGLTSYEIRTYSSLLKGGELTASDLSQKSGVPYSKIYEVLGSLEEKGWIGSDDSRPTKYFAKSPATAMEATKQKIESDFKENENVVLRELVPLYEDSCRSEVLIALPKANEILVKQALPKLRLLHDKGVVITILMSDEMDKESLKALARVSTVKVKKGLFGGGIISDKRYVVILLGPINEPAEGEAVAIWADHAGLAVFAREYFEYLLKDAKSVS
ncbi:MAG: TrmB family transcriptional regulator [Nitrososphaeria archaeon]|nr:TrmB family transcriptional regulator [Nitrososphaeria archaeon]